MKRWLFRPLVAAMLLATMVLPSGYAFAGTTGSISGTLTDSTTGKPVADAKITAISPSQTASAQTDASGHFGFIALAPDTYTVSAEKDGFAPVAISGVTVFADQSQRVAITTHPEIKTIAQVTSRAAGNLVKPGTTHDVYSVNSATQQTVQGIGGGGNLNNAYSAVYTTPGVTSYVGNYGFGQVFYIRGGNYDQSGYEYDGVPVNRSFDNYNANSLSTLGQQELEIYTGSSPSGASSATQVGFINQVIKTGTFPGFGTATGQVGAPAFNHALTVEAGGASPNRLFSYYVGLTGLTQTRNFIDNSNGGGLSYDGSNQYGLAGFGFVPIVGFNVPLFANGPWTTCSGTGNSIGTAPPGSSTWWVLPPAAGGGFGIPACESYQPYQSQLNYMDSDREAVANFHFGIPHHNDAGRDDVQLLYSTFGYHSLIASSLGQQYGNATNLNAAFNGFPALYGLYASFGLVPPNYVGQNGPYSNICAEMALLGNTCVPNGPNPLPFKDGYIFAPGTTFGQSASTAVVVPYLFPSTGDNRTFNAPIPTDYQEGIWNNGSIVKLQYQKNIGSNSYVRLFGYTFYSDWLNNGASAWSAAYDTFLTPLYGLASSDYELNTHTRGAELQYANQINPQNLIRFTANYTNATVHRNNNGSGGPNWQQGLSFPATNLTNGTSCFDQTSGAAASCYSGASAGSYGAPAPGPVPGPAAAAGASWEVTVPQLSGGYLNAVRPTFTSLALEDEFRPSERWDLNIGLRYENYKYDLTNLNNPEYNFWFAQAQHDFCVDPATGLPMLKPISPSTSPGSTSPVIGFGAAGCPVGPSGVQGVHPDGNTPGVPILTNIGPSSITNSLVSPRISGTYTMDPDDVIRFAAGRFSQPTPTAFEQYYFGSGRLATTYQFAHFYPLGFNTSVHDNPVQVTNNYDLSYEKHLHGTDITFKLTPFYRYAQDQSTSVSLGPNFVSAVNTGTQRTTGVEVAIQKGDPTRDGLSGALAYTYVNAKVKYGSIGSAQSPIGVLNNYIVAYNRMTQTCASVSAMQNDPRCNGGQTLSAAQAAALVAEDAPCYNPAVQNPLSPGGVANLGVGCTSNTYIKNPYFGDTAHGLLDVNGYYQPYPNFPPGDPELPAGPTALSPNQFSGWLSYKHDKFTIAPNFVLAQGVAYGDPTSVIGLDPRHCGYNQGSGGSGVIKGPNTNADFEGCSWSPYTATGFFAIPDPYTHTFDGMGQFRDPWQFNLGVQLRYDVSPKVTATLVLSNIYNTCFGGDNPGPWSAKYSPGTYNCGFIDNTPAFVGTQPGAGFFYGSSSHDPANGTAGHPAIMDYPYAPVSAALPFQAYLQVQVKL